MRRFVDVSSPRRDCTALFGYKILGIFRSVSYTAGKCHELKLYQPARFPCMITWNRMSLANSYFAKMHYCPS